MSSHLCSFLELTKCHVTTNGKIEVQIRMLNQLVLVTNTVLQTKDTQQRDVKFILSGEL